ncbi:hypothetical protein BCIN_06g04070 [Botrytis cinerea B05.10]|uniref:DUF300-domain-containing protein n=1 Tax=Botryotinia fuckeliana (strain B05.10) TaxID=332648 RepID=A0A384JKD4_BOTFB|nr:hypothetical protein BCIN_06g04070 [Botrytis cinerea B05.10]ATZ50942.1 hypothetical protein BCIN_06g04070 [Botrytis cinerea B05.10]
MQYFPIQAQDVHFQASSKRNSDSSENRTCPVEDINDPPQVPFVNNLSFHQFIQILSGACLAFSLLLSIFLILRHATHYSMPREQKQIIRITFMIPVFATVSFLCITFEDAAAYISPINELYEAFAFAAFFQLLYTYVIEETHAQSFTGQASQYPPIRKTAIQIFQFPAIMFIVFLIEEISEAKGTYCETEIKVYFTRIWCVILRICGIIIAMLALLRFYNSTKSLTAARKPLHKLIVFKGIVFINFVQTIVFSFLSSRLSPTNKVTTRDLTDGIPNLLISLEMVIFSIIFIKFYTVSEYAKGSETYQGGFMGIKAIVEAANFIAFIWEMVRLAMGKETTEKGGNYETVNLTAGTEYDHSV